MKKTILWLLMSLLLVGCGGFVFNPQFDPVSGCVLQKIKLQDEKFEGQTGYVGYCPKDYSVVARWAVNQPEGIVWYQVHRTKAGLTSLQYKSTDGTWVVWNSKAGLDIRVPEDFLEDNFDETVASAELVGH